MSTSEKSRRFLVRMSYVGTSYRGSQKHVKGNLVDVDSIQGTIESSFCRLAPSLVEPPNMLFSGRTDAGVHALNSVAHIDLERRDGEPINKDETIKLMNRYLINCHHQIRIHEFYQVSKDFHARYSATNREYMYRFMVSKKPNFYRIPMCEMERTLHLSCDNFDLETFKRALAIFNNRWDFTTFSSRSIDRYCSNEFGFKSYLRDMKCWMEEAPPLMPSDPLSDQFSYYHVFFLSKGFLYNQIRKIMGALFGLSFGKLTEQDILLMLRVPNRKYYRCWTAEAHGLYLKNIHYDENLLKEVVD